MYSFLLFFSYPLTEFDTVCFPYVSTNLFPKSVEGYMSANRESWWEPGDAGWTWGPAAEGWTSLYHTAPAQARPYYVCTSYSSSRGIKCALPRAPARDSVFRGQLYFGLDQYYIFSWTHFLHFHCVGPKWRNSLTLKVPDHHNVSV